MRRGMWWGKSDLKKKMEDLKAEQEDLQKGIDARDGLNFAKEKGESRCVLTQINADKRARK